MLFLVHPELVPMSAFTAQVIKTLGIVRVFLKVIIPDNIMLFASVYCTC